jgi:hypothetical protein
MNDPTEWLTKQQLKEQLSASIPNDMNIDQVMAGVLLALKPPDERTRPVELGIGKPDVVYAWHESDASVTKLALEVLAQLGLSFLSGPSGVANLGVALKELVCFLVQLNRHRVRVSDPIEISVLLLLNDARAGLTSKMIRQKLADAHGSEVAPKLSEVEDALARLANSASSTGPKPLVRADGQIWKSLV